jgi:hypothetical protein
VRISLTLQAALREHVPDIYFADAGRYENVKAAYPMLVYQASRPFRGKVRTELTYDVLNPRSLAALFRRAKAGLVPLLERVEGQLRLQEQPDLADKYLSKRAGDIIQSVQRLSVSRRLLYLLVRGEGALLDALIELSGFGNYSPSEQVKRWAALGRRWNYQLRHLYPGRDFTSLAPLLLGAVSKVIESPERTHPGPDSDGDAIGAGSIDPGSSGL